LDDVDSAQQIGAPRLVKLIAIGLTLSGAFLHYHSDPLRGQLPDKTRNHSDTIFLCFDFSWDAYNHIFLSFRCETKGQMECYSI